MSSLFANKHDAIVAAAIEVFIESGYAGTSMDRVAARAKTSKVTVYNHFRDKKQLFEQVMAVHCQELSKDLAPLKPATNKSVQKILEEFAQSLVDILVNPRSIALMRMVIFEMGQFPELGPMLWPEGKLPMLNQFQQYLKTEHQQGRLYVEDDELAARHFFGLLKESLVWPIFFGLPEKGDESFRSSVIAKSIEVFLSYYGAR